MTQRDMLMGMRLKKGWSFIPSWDGSGRLDANIGIGTNSRKGDWWLEGRPFAGPILYQPDMGYSDKEVLLGALATFLALEEHESLEWFQVEDGKPFVDPHDWHFDYRNRQRGIYEWLTRRRA